MGRASNPAVPQRVSAHVLPKAQPVDSDDEDEKTTIESGWEEEASTTVEQGDVAEKIRALGIGVEAKRSNTNVTSTSGGVSEEPTVDDQRGNAAVALLPPSAVARLVITAGADLGQVLEVRPGKTFSVGRGLDNDLVLSDLAVSRKHFELHHQAGAWVLADRASGNGTLINHRIEDAPSMLASGDVIEIGNTVFRFELEAPGPVVSSSGELSDGNVPSTDVDPVDEESELSTVSGKPLRELDGARGNLANRPKTLPPPAPRPRPSTNRPPGGFDRPMPLAAGPLLVQSLQPSSLPAPPLALIPNMPGVMAPAQTTMPLPQMANRPPLLPQAILQDPPTTPQATTLPGQGPPVQPGPPGSPQRMPFGLPVRAEAPLPGMPAVIQPVPRAMPGAPTQIGQPPRGTPLPPGAMGAHAPAGPHAPPRDATSTALVQPISYSRGQPVIGPPQPYSAMIELSRRAKMALAATGIVVLIALITVAIISSGSDPRPSDKPLDGAPAVEPHPTVEPIREPAGETTERTAPGNSTPAPVAATPPVTQPPTPPVAPPVTQPPATPANPPPAVTAIAAPPVGHPAVPPPVAQPPAPTDREAEAQAARVDHRPPKHVDHVDSPRRPTHPEITRSEPRPEPPAIAKQPPKHTGRSAQDVRNDANALYRARNFSGAAALISAAAPSFTGGDQSDLKTLAAVYNQLGKAYNVGMAPGTKPTEAYDALKRAKDLDRGVGSAYIPDIDKALVVVASRAAASFMAAKEYERAFQAVRISDSLGSTSPTNRSVREALEVIANELYRQAISEQATAPDDAKAKLHQILGMVDAKNPVYLRASKLLNP